MNSETIKLLVTDTATETLLRAKNKEYSDRQVNPEKSEHSKRDAQMKKFVASELLERGEVTFNPLQKKAIVEFGDSFSADAFASAWEVIKDYVLTGGKNLTRKHTPISA